MNMSFRSADYMDHKFPIQGIDGERVLIDGAEFGVYHFGGVPHMINPRELLRYFSTGELPGRVYTLGDRLAGGETQNEPLLATLIDDPERIRRVTNVMINWDFPGIGVGIDDDYAAVRSKLGKLSSVLAESETDLLSIQRMRGIRTPLPEVTDGFTPGLLEGLKKLYGRGGMENMYEAGT